MKTILITGASGGIGTAIARELASPSCSLFLHYYKNEQAILNLAKECKEKGAIVQFIKADLTQDNGDEQILSQIPEDIAFHTIIHNAGISQFGLFTDVSNREMNQLMNVHLLNPMKITRRLLPNMIKLRHGKIIMISSIWGETGASCEVVYSAAKGGVNSFVKGLAKEVAPSQIQVNAIAPGAIQTEMLSKIDDEHLKEIQEEIPANRLGQPSDIAHAVRFLSSEKSNYINGQILSINGAWYC
ncbi:3-oxoacyl-[acyl-carrier protein] reductase [Halalkalibacter wakoensis JCM 9140]|uniref:3-oxoacyl-[acyl-carrier protein] reductase n=1 Tax=Halalkalibacter wakoensis JCM 9140 TaxID=1236970 RepID=W4PXX0_9BACI|nr:SDR family oxidoreductase [Halalkalibacter wakoensis]GAE24323.1 3-oxoacyl-[acyl-carrier protein] reductase [Halalkalibacter wakoensis JCM 9140]